MKAEEGSRKRKLLKMCLFLIRVSIPLPYPLLPHTQIPVWVYVGKSQISRWRTKYSIVICKFIKTFHNLPCKYYTSEVTKCYASHCLPHVFLYENKYFLCGNITEGAFDEKHNILDNSVRDKYGSKTKRLSVC